MSELSMSNLAAMTRLEAEIKALPETHDGPDAQAVEPVEEIDHDLHTHRVTVTCSPEHTFTMCTYCIEALQMEHLAEMVAGAAGEVVPTCKFCARPAYECWSITKLDAPPRLL